jgi:RNA polymerase sigma factor for flagellar operon FliA
VVKLLLKNVMSTVDLGQWEKWKTQRDPEAGDYLVEKYQHLIDYVIQRFMISLPKTVHKDDIQSYAYEGMLDAIDKFNLDGDFKFETYAVWRVKGAIIDGLRQSDWLPRSVREKVKKVEKAYTVLEQLNGKSATDEEVCEYLGISKAELNKTVSEAAFSSMISIDETIKDDENHQVGRYNVIKNEKAESPEAHLYKQVLKESLTKAIELLPEKEKLIVTLCYFEELKLTEIAEVLNLSVSRISQLHSKAMLRLNAAILSIQENY